jgi:formylglycine-generating enzyme required for sulfatase activity
MKRRSGRLFAVLLAGALSGPVLSADYAAIPGGHFESAVPADGKSAQPLIAPYLLRTEPVTNAEFLSFVETHPQWRRDRIAALFADDGYLAHWSGPLKLGAEADARQPVTRVSWFAARAYCESENARLPTWYEWEFAAAADAHARDARQDPAWRAQTLDWYSRPSSAPLPAVGGSANVYGVRDLNGVVWEWVEDFNALLVASDNRNTSDTDRLKFCGAGALSLQRTDEYAVLMRIAMLSSLQANYTTRTLGFRCARDTNPGAKP